MRKRVIDKFIVSVNSRNKGGRKTLKYIIWVTIIMNQSKYNQSMLSY